MEDFDVFTDEVNYTKPFFMNILNKYVKDVPATPSGPNYQSGRKLLAEEYLASQNEVECAFNLSEAVSATLRIIATYRDEQMKMSGTKTQKITTLVKPVKDVVDKNAIPKDFEDIFAALTPDVDDITTTLEQFEIDEEVPFYRKYMKFGPHNNPENFMKILKELPKEWTVIQLTAPFNPNENLKPLTEYRTEISSILLSMFTNDYFDDDGVGPLTVNVPANVVKEGEKPLFVELYSLLDDNYKIIDNAQFLNSKHLVQNYWNKREETDLRMKSVIMVMDKEWLGGFGSLLTGKLVDGSLRERIVKLVDQTISDWGFIKLTKKQKILLYNLIESCSNLSSNQIKSCIRRILTEHGNIEDLRRVIDTCQNCTKEFVYPNDLCLQCLSKSFEKLHCFTLVDGIRAFSQAAKIVRENDEWSGLKKAKRYPVVLIVDEILDTFPWETLPILNQHPVCRIENIHFLYYLYKIHENKIKDGYFITDCDIGRYVINPEKNLDRMENRMASFVKYWCPDWSGHIGEPPPPEEFLKYLEESDLFLYCGHGDGCRFAAGGGRVGGVEGAGGVGGGAGGGVGCGAGSAVLSGCGSVRLAHPPGRAAPAAPHHHLHIAASPIVIGMLWEVTDLEVDKVVSTLISLCVPSPAAVPWPAVGKAQWSNGVLDTNVDQKTPFVPERDILRAISRARGSSGFVMISSSVVARGLPVRVNEHSVVTNSVKVH